MSQVETVATAEPKAHDLLGTASIVAGVCVLAASALGLAAIQYAMPLSLEFLPRLDPPGARLFSDFYSVAASPLSPDAFRQVFRVLMVLMWAGWAVAVLGALRIRRLPLKWIFGGAAGFIVLLAFVFPASLTHDLFGYLGFARMSVLAGWNPYVRSLSDFALTGDAAAVHSIIESPTAYGPGWTLLTMAVAWVMQSADLVWQLIALKLVAGASVLAIALAGREIALVHDPDRADVAFLALVLNPLLLIEGPCNGHNDVFMVALMMAGMALVSRSSPGWGFLMLGLSASVKWVSLAVVPWLVIEQLKAEPDRGAVRAVATAGVLSIAPVAVLLLPFWRGGATLSGIATTYVNQSRAEGTDWAGLVLLVLVYAALSVWQLLRRLRGEYIPAWSSWGALAVFFGMPLEFPWYMTWSAGPTLTRWDRRQRIISIAVMLLALWLSLQYAGTRG